MKMQLTELHNISGRNARYVIFTKVKNDLNENKSIKKTAKNILVRFFKPKDSSIIGFGRRLRRMAIGPRTTEQLSKKYGRIPEPGTTPNIEKELGKFAGKALLHAASARLNRPSGKGNVTTDVIKNITPLTIANAAVGVGKLIQSLRKSPEEPKEETPETPTKSPTGRPVEPSYVRKARFKELQTQLADAEKIAAIRGSRQIDLMKPENRIELVRRYQKAQDLVSKLTKDVEREKAGGFGRFGLRPLEPEKKIK